MTDIGLRQEERYSRSRTWVGGAYLDTHAEGDGEGDHDQEVGEEGQDKAAPPSRVMSS